ncbi:MAG TPA: hypothetical protein VM261_33150 [Kofleriaceae bacterium]|nr:hypothetical protein [Kofleriaceae bacterium]
MRMWTIGLLAAGCSGSSSAVDAGVEPMSTAHCAYAPLPPTARAGAAVNPGALMAGVAEAPLPLPLSSALGGNTSRCIALDDQGRVDARRTLFSDGFNASVGIETIPHVKALALTAGGETIVLLKSDTIFGNDAITFAVEERMGADFAGKVVWASSHTHTSPEQYSSDLKLQVGGGELRQRNFDAMVDGLVAVAQEALARRVPAKLGLAAETSFDPDDAVSYDRREENDDLFGGQPRKDTYLGMIRVDAVDGSPIAIVPVLGNHAAILSDSVGLFSTDIAGMYEKLVEEEFDRPVMVMHLQGAGGDVLPSSHRHLAIPDGRPDNDFARSEENARRALPAFMALWNQAGASMRAEVAMEMVTRSVALGPDWNNFRVRGGALGYAPFDPARPADREIFASDGTVRAPIDEFNAPAGAGLCGDPGDDTFLNMRMPNVGGLAPYHSCGTLPGILPVLAAFIRAEFEPAPLCASTRTTISALRIDDWMLAFAPGEPLVLWAETLRARSPAAPEKTIVVGYAQGHVGYLLTADDWLRGGFEPSINLWGPLEGETILEQLGELMATAWTPQREDAAATGADRVVPARDDDRDVPPPDAAPQAGTVPSQLPDELYLLGDLRVTSAQPPPTVPRVTGIAHFVWIGEDPLASTPRIRLERETAPGQFTAVRRRSQRIVEDLDVVLTWTPQPLVQVAGGARTHYWAITWQAVAPLGAPGLPALADRPGLPLGRYRFHVDGGGYELDSAAFEVVAGPLSVSASASASEVTITAAYEATDGFRMLALEGLSNRRVPLATAPVTVTLGYASGAEATLTVTTDVDGAARVTPATVTGLTTVSVRDRFGNGSTVTVP